MSEKVKWYNKNWLAIVLLIFFYPVGLYAIIKNKNFNKVTKWILSIVVLVFLIFAYGSDTTSETNKTAKKENIKIEKKEVKKTIADLSFFEIRAKFETMTEAQFKAYVRTLKGKRIRWKGYAKDVNEKILGGFELYVDFDKPGSMSVQDLTFEISKADALKIQKNQSVLVEGDIDNILNILGSCQVILKNIKYSY